MIAEAAWNVPMPHALRDKKPGIAGSLLAILLFLVR
jgi:hypothetical protein